MNTVKAGQLRTWKPRTSLTGVTRDDIVPGDLFLVTESYLDRSGRPVARIQPVGHRRGWLGGVVLTGFIRIHSEPVEDR